MKRRRTSALDLWRSIRRPPVRPTESIPSKKQRQDRKACRRPVREDD